MKKLQLISVLAVFFALASCSSVRVNSDYDKKATFENYKTYAYSKNNLDNMEISDLDKKRILYAMDEVMTTKNFAKNENPDILVNLFTKEQERIDVRNNIGFGWGLGWGGPFWGMNSNTVSRTPEGTLIINLIDAKTKELIWQGEGSGYLTKNIDKKDARIMEFVSKILAQYPPEIK
jgi:PBP1b-binding outer membrane lipoprotein LpoB